MFIRQKYDWDCGAACFANSYYVQTGKRIKLGKAIELCGTTVDGTSDYDLVAALKSVGFPYSQRREPSNQNRAFRSLKTGDIVCIDRWAHWVMIVQKLNDSVIIHDPELGLVELNRKKFKRRWKFMGTYFYISVQ